MATEILAHIAALWPDCEFTDAELSIVSRECKGVPDDQAKAAIDEVKATRTARKPAIAWIIERLRRIRQDRRNKHVGSAHTGYFSTLRAKWAKDGMDVSRMSDRQVVDLYWQRQVDRAIEVYGESQGFDMLRRRAHEWAQDLDRANFQYGLARTFVQEQLAELWRTRIEPVISREAVSR